MLDERNAERRFPPNAQQPPQQRVSGRRPLLDDYADTAAADAAAINDGAVGGTLPNDSDGAADSDGQNNTTNRAGGITDSVGGTTGLTRTATQVRDVELREIQNNPNATNLAALEDPSWTATATQSGTENSFRRSPLKFIIKTGWISLSAQIINFIITFIIFPGISLAWFPKKMDGSNNQTGVYALGVFQLFDVVGRYLPEWESMQVKNEVQAMIATCLRALFIPLWIWLYGDGTGDDAPGDDHFQWYWKFLAMIFMAISNGYCCTMIFIRGPERFKSPKDKDFVASILSLCVTIGILIGSVGGLLVKDWFNIKAN